MLPCPWSYLGLAREAFQSVRVGACGELLALMLTHAVHYLSPQAMWFTTVGHCTPLQTGLRCVDSLCHTLATPGPSSGGDVMAEAS